MLRWWTSCGSDEAIVANGGGRRTPTVTPAAGPPAGIKRFGPAAAASRTAPRDKLEMLDGRLEAWDRRTGTGRGGWDWDTGKLR